MLNILMSNKYIIYLLTYVIIWNKIHILRTHIIYLYFYIVENSKITKLQNVNDKIHVGVKWSGRCYFYFFTSFLFFFHELDQYSPTMAVGIIIFSYMGHTANASSIMLKDKKIKSFWNNFLCHYYYYSFSSIFSTIYAQLFPFVKKK